MGAHTPPPDFGGSEPDVQGPSADPFAATPPPGAGPAPVPEQTPAGPPGPLSVVATVQTALRLYGADMTELWKTVALVIIPVEALVCLLRIITIPTGARLQNGQILVGVGSATGGYLGASLFGDLLTLVAYLVTIGAAYRILLGRYLLHPASLATSVNFGFARAVSLLWVSILVTICVLIGAVFLILPGIYLFVSFGVAIPVLMAEDFRGSGALRRSRQLLAGEWWHTLGCLLLSLVVAAIGDGIIQALFGGLVSSLSGHSIPAMLSLDAALTVIVWTLIYPFTAAVPVVLYVDMLQRKNDPHLPRLLA